MEGQFFSWEEWDEQDMCVLMFYDVTLKVPIKDIPAGTKFPWASVDYQKGKMEFYKKNEKDELEVYSTFDIGLTVLDAPILF